MRDIALQEREDDMVLATHGRGIWVIDDISPLRQLSAPDSGQRRDLLLPGRPVEQRIEGNGGWAEGNATFYGDNPPDGAVITYYQRARHVIGRMKLEILDANGTVVDEIPTSKRVGLNRVTWSMRTKPPQVPPAASIAGASTQGERFLPGHLHGAADQGRPGVDRAADAHARQARDLHRRRPRRRSSPRPSGSRACSSG